MTWQQRTLLQVFSDSPCVNKAIQSVVVGGLLADTQVMTDHGIINLAYLS